LAWLLAARPPDHAEATVTSTTPVDGASLARAPTEVELAFSGPVDPSLSHVSVQDGSGSPLDIGGPHLVAPDRLRQPVAEARAGDVTVAYHVTLVGGAELAGSLRFSTGSGTAADATPATGHQHGIDPVGAALLAIDGIVLLAAVILLIRRPPPGTRRSQPA
jgi:methionine-rich copper-binding protein CopC